MIRVLGQADFKVMPWANGKGQTIEMLRADRDGAMVYRLSRASVVESGDFSIFAGVERNLTVLTGPGFDLVGAGLHLAARPMQPVAFAGDVAIRAEGVTDPSDDFNVMTARGLPLPEVRIVTAPCRLMPVQGGLLAIYDPDAAVLIVADEAVEVSALPVIAVFLALG